MVVAAYIVGCSVSDKTNKTRSKDSESQLVVFEDMAVPLGVDFIHDDDGATEHFFPAIMTGGAAFLDLDQDNDLDVLLLNGRRARGPRDETTQDGTSSRLFLQSDAMHFSDATAGSGLTDLGYATGCAAGDINNDGRIDLYVTAYGPDSLLLNQGSGRFETITESAGIANVRWGTSAAFLDYDRDGWLDLFVANYVDYDSGFDCVDPGGRRDFCNPAMFPGTSDRLYRNMTGDHPNHSEVRFSDVTLESGIASARGAGLGVITADFNGDGWIDIYVANDGHGNFLWTNQHNGTFENQAALKGAAYDPVGQAQGSMGVSLGDLNGDGLPDLVVANLDGESNMVYGSLGDGYVDNSITSGVAASSFGMTGFGIALFDVDNDADLDLAVANGRVRRKTERDKTVDSGVASSLKEGQPEGIFWRDYREHSQVLRHEAGRFTPDASSRNDLINSSAVGRGLCPGDFNNDGRVDLLVTFLDRPAAIYVNKSEQTGHWQSVRLVEPQLGGRDATGAQATLVTTNGRQNRWLSGGGSYLCALDSRLHFGLGAEEQFDAIEVVWPNGDKETFSGGPADQFLILKHDSGTPQ
ncbi:MAG: CRTAC1 family protein [Planctomycetota bacterium]|nr:CRTAC1 family protein [Planctomycetota bacterium]